MKPMINCKTIIFYDFNINYYRSNILEIKKDAIIDWFYRKRLGDFI